MPVKEMTFSRIIAHVKRVITPLMDVDEIREHFGIDLCSGKHFRFIRAMTQVANAGVALLRFPSNLQEGWMKLLNHHLVDWLTIKFAITTLFVESNGEVNQLMSPKHWVEVLAVRDRLYRAAVQSADFGAVTQEFLSYFLNVHTLSMPLRSTYSGEGVSSQAFVSESVVRRVTLYTAVSTAIRSLTTLTLSTSVFRTQARARDQGFFSSLNRYTLRKKLGQLLRLASIKLPELLLCVALPVRR